MSFSIWARSSSLKADSSAEKTRKYSRVPARSAKAPSGTSAQAPGAFTSFSTTAKPEGASPLKRRSMGCLKDRLRSLRTLRRATMSSSTCANAASWSRSAVPGSGQACKFKKSSESTSRNTCQTSSVMKGIKGCKAFMSASKKSRVFARTGAAMGSP